MVSRGFLWELLEHIRCALFGRIQGLHPGLPLHPLVPGHHRQGQDMMIITRIINRLLQCLEEKQTNTEKKGIIKQEINKK
jgi:hypothetical protein